MPYPATVTVRATSNSDNLGFGTASVTVLSPVEDWPKYHRDLSNTGRSIETAINSQTAPHLKKRWALATGGKISASPAIATVGGVRTVYVGNWNATFFALEADTGALRWSFAIDPVSGCTNSSTINTTEIGSSAAVANGTVYFGAANGFIYGLDASTGVLKWKYLAGDPCKGYDIWSSPAVASVSIGGVSTNVVYIGVASFNDTPCVPGQVLALTADTGALIWVFNLIDQSTCPSGICVGDAVWSSPALDILNSIVYVGTSNPATACSPPSNLAMATTQYADGVLGLDMATGALKSFYQAIPPPDTEDFDFGSSPVLHSTSTINQCTGTTTTTDWITDVDKNSDVFTFQRDGSGTVGTPHRVSLNSPFVIATPSVSATIESNSSCGMGSLENIVQGNDIVVASQSGSIFDVSQVGDGSTSLAWATTPGSASCQTPLTCPLLSAPATIAEVIIFGGGEGNLYIYDHGGAKVFSFGTSGLVVSAPAISNNWLYFGSFDGNVYCLSVDGQ